LQLQARVSASTVAVTFKALKSGAAWDPEQQTTFFAFDLCGVVIFGQSQLHRKFAWSKHYFGQMGQIFY
jgi:hypothetical protein